MNVPQSKQKFNIHFVHTLSAMILCVVCMQSYVAMKFLATYEIADYPLYKLHCLLFVPVHANTIPAG